VTALATEDARTPAFNLAAFAAVADRLEQVLDGESSALERNQPCDLPAICQRKRQGLLELSRFLPRAAASTEQDAAKQRLDRLAIKLDRNHRALGIQLQAVREVADIIARAMRDADSDGTYSPLGLAYRR
jgi:flagellar biosynthesis/type III secretory pathway chaperone